MANAQLIQMAREIGKSKGFVDVGEEFDKSFGKWMGVAEEALKERRTKRDQGIARVTSYMEKMPSHASLPKIPAYAQEKVGAWLKGQRTEYAANARALRDLDPTGDEYQEKVNAMNKITQSMSTLNDQFSTLLEDKVDFMEGVDGGLISNATTPDEIDLLSNIYTDATEIGISAEGRLDFGGKTFDELPKYISRNSEIPQALTALNAKYYKNSQKIEGPLAKNLKFEVEQIIKSSGKQGIMSLAADNDLNLEEDLITNPARYEELVETMVNTWTTAITEAADIGKKQADAEWKMKHPKKPNPNTLDKFFNKDK